MWPNPQFPADLVTFTEMENFIYCGGAWFLRKNHEGRKIVFESKFNDFKVLVV